MVNKDKKALVNEGRQIFNGKLAYGGFPKVINEGGVVSDYNDADGITDSGVNQATKPDSLENLRKKREEASSAIQSHQDYIDDYLTFHGFSTFDANKKLKELGAAYDAAKAAEEAHPEFVRPQAPVRATERTTRGDLMREPWGGIVVPKASGRNVQRRPTGH